MWVRSDNLRVVLIKKVNFNKKGGGKIETKNKN